MQLRQHEAILKKSDAFRVDPRLLKTMPGFNVRDLDSPAERPDLDVLKEQIRTSGVEVPLEVRLDGEDIYVTAGHRRLKVVMELIEEGEGIESIPAIAEPKWLGEDERAARIKTLNGGKPLSMLQDAMLVKRLLGFGWDRQKIALRFGWKSEQAVANHEALLAIPSDLKEAVQSGEMAATTAIDIARQAGQDATAALEQARETVKATGKKRITPAVGKAAAKAQRKKREPEMPAPEASGAAGAVPEESALLIAPEVGEQIPRRQYKNQKNTAKQRGIEWDITFEEWIAWWQGTGHYHERGCRAGQYVMGRIGDVGPYELSNIICLRIEENSVLPRYASKPGEEHPQAKLTANQVKEIRASKLPARECAEQYGVSKSLIQKIRWGVRWNDSGAARDGDPLALGVPEQLNDAHEEPPLPLGSSRPDPELELPGLAKANYAYTDQLGLPGGFTEDNLSLLVSLAQRAVIAGLATDTKDDVLVRLRAAAGPTKEAHERALRRRITRQDVAAAPEKANADGCVTVLVKADPQSFIEVGLQMVAGHYTERAAREAARAYKPPQHSVNITMMLDWLTDFATEFGKLHPAGNAAYREEQSIRAGSAA